MFHKSYNLFWVSNIYMYSFIVPHYLYIVIKKGGDKMPV